jgi:PKD domain
MMRQLAASIAVTVMVLAASTNAVAAPEWLPIVRMTPPSGDETTSQSPTLAVDAAGDVLLTWVTLDYPKNDPPILKAVLRRATEREWPQPVSLGSSYSGTGDVVSALDDKGDATLAFTNGAWVQTTSRLSSDGIWREHVTLSSNPYLILSEGLATNGDGAAIVGWAGEIPDDHVGVSARPSASGNWSPGADLFTPTRDCNLPVVSPPGVAIDRAGNAIVVWTCWKTGASRESSQVVEASFRRGVTGLWAAPVVLATPKDSVTSRTEVAFDAAGNATVIWTTDGEVVAAYRTLDGVWSQPSILTDPRAGQGAQPQLRLDDAGNAVVAWYDAYSVDSAVRSAATGSWGTVADLSTGTSRIFSAPKLATDRHGNAVAVWSDGEWTKGSTLWSALRPAATGRWQAPVRLTEANASEYAIDPIVGIDGSGNAVVAWQQFGLSPSVIAIRELRANGPILERVAIPKRGIARKNVRFAVQPVPWGAPLATRPRWLFGDGRTASGLTVTHAYRRAGTYTVTVSQVDSTGARTTASKTTSIVRPLSKKHRR